MTKKEQLITWYHTIDSFSDLEDYYIKLMNCIDNKLEDNYWTIIRLKDNILNILWYSPCNFITNIIKYRKFLWEDRWYDYWFLLNAIQIKLEQDAKNYRNNGICTSTDEVAKEMENTVALIKRINNDNYDDFKQSKVDIKNLFDYIGNNILKWWD